MYARVLRKWSLAKFLMYLWLPVIMLLVIWCQDATSMHLSTNTRSKIATTVSPIIVLDNTMRNHDDHNEHNRRKRINNDHRNLRQHLTISNYHPYQIFIKANVASNAAGATVPKVPNLNSQIINLNNNINNYNNNNNNNNNEYSSLTSSANIELLSSSKKAKRHVYVLPPSRYMHNNNNQKKQYSSQMYDGRQVIDRREQQNQEQQLSPQNQQQLYHSQNEQEHEQQYIASVESRTPHERYERVTTRTNRQHNYSVKSLRNDRQPDDLLILNENVRIKSPKEDPNEMFEWAFQQREKNARIEAHRRRFNRHEQQLSQRHVVDHYSQPHQHDYGTKSKEISVLSAASPHTSASASSMAKGISTKLTITKPVMIDNDLNKLMIGRNRRDSRSYSLNPMSSSSLSSHGSYSLSTSASLSSSVTSRQHQHPRRRPKRYCSARDPTQLAFEAPTVFEGKVRSMSSDRRANFSVTFEVKEIFKREKCYKLPQLLRLQFTYRNTTSKCDIYSEQFRSRGLVRDELEQGRVYILFLKQIDLGNFSILGQPIKKTRRAVNAVRIGVSENYAQPASIKSLTSNKTSLPNNEELRIVCKVRGQPPPKVTWFKDGRSIRRNHTFNQYQFVHLKRRSELIVRSFRNSDPAGLYECRAKNKVTGKPDKKSIRIEPSQKTPKRNEEGYSSGDECPDPYISYCLNGATCKYFKDIGIPSCTCPDGFNGARCEEKKPSNLEPSPTYKSGYMADEPATAIDSGEDDEEDEDVSESEESSSQILAGEMANKLLQIQK